MLPDCTISYFYFNSTDTEAPTAISIDDWAWDDKPERQSGDIYRVDKVEVCIWHSGETAPKVDAYGRRLTKTGTIDKRESYSKLVHMTNEDQARFIAYAQEVVK